MTQVDSNWYALRNALFEGRYEEASTLIATQPSLLYLTNSIGETVLHFLAVENELEAVAWLRAHGADLDTKNNFGAPVLFEVASLEYRELFAWLIQQGADALATDADGNDVVEHLREHDKEDMAQWVQRELQAL